MISALEISETIFDFAPIFTPSNFRSPEETVANVCTSSRVADLIAGSVAGLTKVDPSSILNTN